MNKKNSSILIIGAILGALIGVGAAYMYSQQDREDRGALKPKDAMNLSVAVIAVLRQIADLGK